MREKSKQPTSAVFWGVLGMRYALIVLGLLLCCGDAFAGGPQLFKEFSYGQTRGDILKTSGIFPCDSVREGALCREAQSFSGLNDWAQILVFENGKLTLVGLSGDAKANRLQKVATTLVSGGFLPLVLQSGDKHFDGISVIRKRGAKAFDEEFGAFESAALNGREPLIYTFAKTEQVKGAGSAATYIEVVRNAGVDMRAVEVEATKSRVIVRFLAPKAALVDHLEQMKGTKETF